MVSLDGVFWMFVILFGVIGAFRGWAKEILALAAMILGLFIQTILEAYAPGVRNLLSTEGGMAPLTQFLIKGGLFAALAFFGYQTPNLPGVARPKFARERLQDWLLGGIIGMVNGYLLIGTLWFYMHQTGYPFEPRISAPTDPAVLNYLRYMPPVTLGGPRIFFAIALAFAFVIMVFV